MYEKSGYGRLEEEVIWPIIPTELSAHISEKHLYSLREQLIMQVDHKKDEGN